MSRGAGKPLQPSITGGVSLLLLVTAIALFYGLTLREGHNWGGDFSQYIHHARNIAEGRSYHDIRVIRNPLNYVAPQIYPPLTSLVLAPVYYYFGLDLTAMKLEQLAIFCLSLLVMGKLFSRCLSTPGVLAVIALFALNPYVWVQKDNIHSEYLFMLFSFLSLLLMDLHYRQNRERSWRYSGWVLGLVMYLAYASREIGVVLPLTLVCYEIVALRRLTWTALISVAVFLLLALLQESVLVPQSLYPVVEAKLSSMAAGVGMGELTHSSIFRFELGHVARQILRYGESLKEFWSVSYSPGLIVAGIFSLLALTGYVRRLWRRISVPEIYTAGYIAVILLFSGFQGMRYLLPVIPLYLYYAFIGLQLLGEQIGRRIVVALLLVIMAGVGSIYLHDYREQDFKTIENGISSPDAVAMFDYIRKETLPGDLIIFRKPRVMALFTDRQSAIYPARYNPPLLLEFMEVVAADYVVAGHFDTDLDTLVPVIDQYPERFSPAFRQGEFTVYRYVSPKVVH